MGGGGEEARFAN